MAYPPAYTRTFSFTDWETTHPGEPKPGAQLDDEYDDVSNALTATQDALALIQRADGALANGSVGVDQLDPTLFDGIADDAVADAEAAAAAAAASASASAGSASSAASAASAASASASTASGAAAQAGVSQGIAQGAAVDAANSADEAEDFATNAANSANQAQGFRDEAGMHEELAFDWAEKLEGPVMPAPPGWPEAVDDGMFSSKWWAIRARDYMSVETVDLGSGQADIGDAWDEWAAIPGNEQPLGLVYATWEGNTYLLADPNNPSDPDSWLRITGLDGPPGPPNTLTIGTVTSGTPSSATITGTSPNQVLNLVLEPGPQGPQGIQGPPGSAAFANPTATVGLAAVNGVSAFAMRSDAAPALDQGIAPTWTGAHTFTNGNGVGVSNADALIFWNETDSPANGKLWWARANTQHWSLITRTDAGAAGSLAFDVQRAGTAVTALTFGNATDNPTYSFQGTGATTHSGPVTITTGALPFTSSNTATGQAGVFNSNAAGGPFITLQRGGTPFADWGSGGSVIPAAGVTDALAFNTRSTNPILFGTNNNEAARFTGAGALQLTGAFSAGFKSAPGLEMGINAGSGWIQAYNRSTSAFIGLVIEAVAVDVHGSTAVTGEIYLGGKQAFNTSNDGYLRLNNAGHFTNGVYTPGQIRAAGGFQSDVGLFGQTTPACNLRPNYSGGLPYSSVFVSGTVGGYAGYAINDALALHLMSEGTQVAGIYMATDGKWLLRRLSSASAESSYNITAASFTTTSARALKRETGAPSKVADILSKLRPILYRLLADDDREQLGLIAEEVRDVCPHLSDGKSVAYDRLAILLLAAWQEQHAVA